MDKGVAHEQCRHDGEEGDQRISHHDLPRLDEIVFPVQSEIECEGDEQDRYIEDLSEECKLVLGVVLMQSLVLFHKRLHCTIGLVCNNLSSSNDLLSFLNDTCRKSNA